LLSPRAVTTLSRVLDCPGWHSAPHAAPVPLSDSRPTDGNSAGSVGRPEFVDGGGQPGTILLPQQRHHVLGPFPPDHGEEKPAQSVLVLTAVPEGLMGQALRRLTGTAALPHERRRAGLLLVVQGTCLLVNCERVELARLDRPPGGGADRQEGGDGRGAPSQTRPTEAQQDVSAGPLRAWASRIECPGGAVLRVAGHCGKMMEADLHHDGVLSQVSPPQVAAEIWLETCRHHAVSIAWVQDHDCAAVARRQLNSPNQGPFLRWR